MKIAKFIFIFFLILIVLLSAAVVIFIATFDVNRYKGQIVSQVSKTLNRQVDFQKAQLAFSLQQGIIFKVFNLTISEDPAFGKGDFFAVKDASFGIDLLGYIFRKEINVANVIIDSLRVVIIRNKEGQINAQSIAGSASEDKKNAGLAVPALLISSLKMTNSTVVFVDRTFDPAVDVEVSNIDVLVKRFSLDKEFPVTIEAAVFSDQKNVRVDCKARLDIQNNEISIIGLKGSTDLSRLVLKRIADSLPMIGEDVLPGSIKGNFDVAVEEFTAGTRGFGDLIADVSVSEGGLQIKELALPIEKISVDASVTPDKITLNDLSVSIGEGKIHAEGVIRDYLTEQIYNLAFDVKNFDIQEMVNQDAFAVKAKGLVSAGARVSGKGFSPEAVKSNIEAEALVSVVEGGLKNINILRAVLDKISVLPGLSQKFEQELPERFKQKLTLPGTDFSDIKLPVAVKDGRFMITDGVLEADEFLFKGRGEAGFDATFSLEGDFFIPQDMSLAMITAVDEMKYLLNENKQLYFPLKVTGKMGDFDFGVDLDYIAKKLIVEQAKKNIFRVIDKAITGDKSGEADSGNDEDQTQEERSKKSVIGDVLRGILNE